MSEIICHHSGVYNIYNTISDGFYYEDGISLEQLKSVIERDYGQRGLEILPDRLERAHKNGTSSIHGSTLDELLSCNRAGQNEKELTYEECINQFFGHQSMEHKVK